MMLSASAAIWLLAFVTPIALWVAWSDMKWMKIQNAAVLALLAVYILAGLLTLPWQSWAWGWVSFFVVLVVGFALSMGGLVGAGDAKFAAAMAPFIAMGDLSLFLLLLVCVTTVSVISHRIARRITMIRQLTPDWESWHRRDFPMGLALGPTLLFYLGLAAVFGNTS
ncbi:MAG: prepilin peptidase [Roseinatronobacter sp.]